MSGKFKKTWKYCAYMKVLFTKDIAVLRHGYLSRPFAIKIWLLSCVN